MSTISFFVVFFFQAEDGIRDYKVTGVQTCALPIFRAQSQAAHLVRLFATRREDEDRHGAAGVPQRAQHAESVHSGKHQIEDDEVGAAVARARQAFHAVVRHLDLIALDLQVVTQAVGEVGVVLDDEDTGHAGTLGEPLGARSAGGSSGNSMTNRTPLPPLAAARGCGSSTQARPPCRATSSRTTASPMPVPATAEPRSRSRRQKRSQTRSRSAGGMPGPSS